MSIASISIKLKIWENLSKVLRADEYIVQMKSKNSNKQRTISKNDVLNEIPFLEKMNVNGYDILFTPVSTKYDYVILSGFDRTTLRMFREGKGACSLSTERPPRGSHRHPIMGFTPCVRTTPAPNTYQVILRVKNPRRGSVGYPRSGSPESQEALKKVAEEICSAYGVKLVKTIYFPGFFNHKSKTMTSTSSTSLRNICCKKFGKLTKQWKK